MASRSDSLLGMGARIARRDFLNTTLLGSGAALLAGLTPREALGQGLGWEGYTGVGDYKAANGNTEAVINGAHSMRDGNYDKVLAETEDTGETYDLAVVGGGIAGLTAALLAKARSPKPLRILILENHPIFGGEARRNDMVVDGVRLEAPQGSNFLTTQRPGNLIDQVYKLIGLDPHQFTYQDWKSAEPAMRLSRHNYEQLFEMKKNFGFYFGTRFGQPEGTWVADPLNNRDKWPAAAAAALGGDVDKFLAFTKKGWAHKDWDQLTPAEEAHLDSITDEQRWQEQAGLSVDGIRTFVSPLVAQMVGLGADAVSGLYMYTWHKSMGDDPDPADKESEHCFPGGNAGVSRHLVKALIPEAIEGPATLTGIWKGRVRFAALDRPNAPVQLRVKSMVVRVEHDGEASKADNVLVTYAQDGKVKRVRARAVVMAGGGWAARRLIRDLPQTHRDAYGTFTYSAFLVANVAVRNWRFLHKMDLMGGRWFEGFGHWTEVRKHAKFAAERPTIGPDSPVVLTFYHPLMYPGMAARDQGTRGRTELIGTPYVAFERRIREHLTLLFGKSGFDAKKHIAGIVLNRWGHAFVTPTPGFYVGRNGAPAPRDVMRKQPHGRIAFSHGDLAGTVNHMHSITESSRAVDQVLKVLAG